MMQGPGPKEGNRKLFILGVGAQRAGTTWVHEQIQRCTGVDMGFTKEYHIFCNPKKSLKGKWRRHRRRQEQLIDTFGSTRRFSHEEFLALPTQQKQILMRIRQHHYYDYFNRLVTDNPAIHTTGDISPYYAQLHAERLRDIRRQLCRRGFKVKVIFLLRDPVDRIQSQLRLIWRDQIQEPIGRQTDPDIALALHFRSRGIERHTRYENTLAAIEAAFPPEDVLVEFHERLFQANSHSRLAKFLQLDLSMPELSEKVNAAPGPISHNQALLEEVARHYSATYAACRERFGSLVDELWPYARFA